MKPMKKTLLLFSLLIAACQFNPLAASLSVAEGSPQTKSGQAPAEILSADPPDTRNGSEAGLNSALRNAVSGWIASLSKQDAFKDWTHATWQVYPLGPGTHGWVVLLSDKRKEIGYLVVAASESAPESYSLQEYGTGGYPLFSSAVLYRRLSAEKLIPDNLTFAQFQARPGADVQRLYFNPMHAVWRVGFPSETGASPVYIDAKTGEIVPLGDQQAASVLSPPADRTGPFPASSITHDLTLQRFDPYDRITWLSGSALAVKDSQDLLRRLDTKPELTWLAETFGNTLTWPLAVIGYQQWEDGEPYIAIEQEGMRYIPFSQIARWGKFYR